VKFGFPCRTPLCLKFLLGMKNTGKPQQFLRHAIKGLSGKAKRHPQSAPLRGLLGLTRLSASIEQKTLAATEILFREAYALDPRDTMAQFGLGQINYLRQNTGRAKVNFDNALRYKREEIDDFVIMTWLGQTFLLEGFLRQNSIKAYAEAENHARQALKSNPNHSAAKILLAKIHLLQGNSNESIGILLETLKQDYNREILILLAFIFDKDPGYFIERIRREAHLRIPQADAEKICRIQHASPQEKVKLFLGISISMDPNPSPKPTAF